MTALSRSGITTSFGFSDSNQLIGILHKKGASTLALFSYSGLDAIGNRTKIETLLGDFNYSYDDNSQLLSATNPEVVTSYASESFTYDEIGNRLTDQLGSYAYNITSQRLTEDFRYSYEYDNNGNLILKHDKVDSSKTTTYTYNSNNQLLKISEFDGMSLQKESKYAYDAIGRRIKKEIVDHQDQNNNFQRRFVYDGSELLIQYDESNKILISYTHSMLRMDDVLAEDVTADGVIKKLAKNAGTYFYLKDGLGSTIDITNGNGDIVQHYAYSAFGKLLKVTNASGDDISSNPNVDPYFTFTGREYDKESGLYYYRARYYDSSIGRFLQGDPHSGSLSNPTTFNNKYIYANNNSVNLVDPNGKLAFLAIVAIAAVVGGTINATFNRGSFIEN